MAVNTLLKWDEVGERNYETGVNKVVLYPFADNEYGNGVAWSGVTGITESPSGAEATALYADNVKYLNLISTEELSATIEAYTYPDEFAACDGSAAVADGVMVGQQSRQTFGLSYVTRYGNDTDGSDHAYKLHLLYGCKAAPSERSYATINDSPEAITFSWSINTTPIEVPGMKVTALITIDSSKVDPVKLASLEQILYGTPAGSSKEAVPARMPLPSEIIEMFKVG